MCDDCFSDLDIVDREIDDALKRLPNGDVDLIDTESDQFKRFVNHIQIIKRFGADTIRNVSEEKLKAEIVGDDERAQMLDAEIEWQSLSSRGIDLKESHQDDADEDLIASAAQALSIQNAPPQTKPISSDQDDELDPSWTSYLTTLIS